MIMIMRLSAIILLAGACFAQHQSLSGPTVQADIARTAGPGSPDVTFNGSVVNGCVGWWRGPCWVAIRQYPSWFSVSGANRLGLGGVSAEGSRQWMFHAGLPLMIVAPVASEDYGRPSDAFSPPDGPTPQHSTLVFAAATLELSSLAADQRDECQQALDRYAGATLAAQRASLVLDILRPSVESRGFTMRCEYAGATTRIVERIDAARAQLQHRECGAAGETLRAAEFEAKRLLRAMGQ